MSSLRPASATAFATSGYCARPGEPESAAAATPSHILLADRNPAKYAPILDHLRQARPSVSVVEAADGPSALAALEAHPIGIALVDRCFAGTGRGQIREPPRQPRTVDPARPPFRSAGPA